MNCPNFNIESVRDEFNKLVIAAGGEPLTIEEFKNKDLRNKRSGVDDLAMQVAYRKYDSNTNPNAVNYSLKSVNILLSDKAKQVFSKGEKNKWSLDKILTELAIPKEQKQLLLDLATTGKFGVTPSTQSKSGVGFVFDQNPELPKIGNEQLYSQYLDTIFPDSKIKDIVYHRTYSDWFKTASFSKDRTPVTGIGEGNSIPKVQDAIYFYYKGKEGNSNVKGKYAFPVILNIKTLGEYTGKGRIFNTALDKKTLDNLKNEISRLETLANSSQDPSFKKEKREEADKLIEVYNGLYDKSEIRQIAQLEEGQGLTYIKKWDFFNIDGITDYNWVLVPNPEQIYILGSKQDVDGFKKFVKQQQESNLREQLAIELQSRYGYNIEIKTQTVGKTVDYTKLPLDFTVNGGHFYIDNDGPKLEVDGKVKIIDLDQFYDQQEYWAESNRTSGEKSNTSFYSDLTVPGGTNYRELEISTPLITPSIKGHAKFSTDNGIGWARVDDAMSRYEEKDREQKMLQSTQFEESTDEDDWGINIVTTSSELNDIKNEGTKTRRVLEMQSDLFQKGRGRNKLAGVGEDESFLKPIKGTEDETGIPDFEKDIDLINQNQFLQLLNKDNNWVTFFIKSIIQDSAKKGYEKVLFPKGETAAKIEGHETLANEIIKIDNAISAFSEIGKRAIDLDIASKIDYDVTESKEQILNRLNSYKQRLESEGIEKFKPIEAFYEIAVGNILEKQFGKNNVKTITDEHGNQWREITLADVNAQDEVLLERTTPPGVNNESGILPLDQNRELYKSLGLIDKNGTGIKVWSYKVWGKNPANILEKVLAKKNNRSDIRDRYEFILKNHPNGLGYAIWLRAKNVDPLTGGQIGMFQRESITHNVISGAKKSFSFNALRNSVKKTIVSIANEMSSRFGIAFSIIGQEELAAIEAKYNVRLSNSRGFYIHQERKAYLVEGKFNESTAVHEIFGHPFLEILKSSPELWHIYNNLATEALKKYSKVSTIAVLYSDKSDRTQTDELIIRLLTDEIESRSIDNGIVSAIKGYSKAFFNFIKNLFNKNTTYTNMNMNISISSLADYVMYGKGEINLLSRHDKSDYAETVNKILSTFGKPNSKSRVTSLASINEAIATHGGRFSSMIDGYKNDAGVPNLRFLNTGIKAMANTVQDGIVYDSLNRKIGEYTLVDGVLTIVSGNEKDIILSILNHESNNNTRIDIATNSVDQLYTHLISCLPHQCIVILSENGTERIVYNKEVRDMYSPVLDVDFERISGNTIHDNNVVEFISTISNGLKAQLHMLERKQSASKEYMDSIRNLINDIDTYGEVDVILKFIDHAEKEVNKVVKQINIATDKMTLGEDIDKVMLNDMRRNFITLYKSAFDSIARINSNYAGVMASIPAVHKAATDKKIDAISKSLMYIESSFYNIQKYAYANLLIEEGEEKRGSSTIRNRFKRMSNGRELDDFYVDRKDVGLLHTVLGNALFSGSEQVRILDRIVSDVNASVNRAMETDGVIAKLYNAWGNVRKKNKLATFSSVMEHDENGKATGYLSHRLKYGKLNAEYNKFMSVLKEKYGIAEFDSLPENDDDRRNFILEKEEWLAKHVERVYTPEYYKLRKSLSPSVAEVLDESEDRIRSFTSKFRGENGKLDTRMMTAKDKNDLFYLQKEKQCLSMFIFPDGTPKMEGTKEYEMAVELQEFYSKLYKNVQFKPNFDAFNEAMTIARESMTESQFNAWLLDNTKVHIDQSFYDSLDIADTSDQSDDWNRMYNIRKGLLKLYRDPNSMEVSANRIKESDAAYERDLLDTIKRIDVYLEKNRVKPRTKSNFREKAEVVPTKEYQIMLDYLLEHIEDEGGQEAYNAFIKEAHYVDSKGKLTRYSYYNKIEPLDKTLITRVPSGIWSEIDESSPYFNKKYDRSLEKYGMQPTKALYDNSKAFKKIESNPELLAFRDALEEAYGAANSHYGYIENPNNLRLAQIPGGFLHKVTHGSTGIISGLKEALSDEFHYREYDDVLGDYSSKDKFYADGSPVMVVPTRFRKMLDNPDQISRDLLLSFAMYYKAALNFSKMSEKTPDIELLLEGIKNTSVINDEERITAGRTNMYQKALEYVNTEVYGRDLANKYELTYRRFNPFKWIYNKITNKRPDVSSTPKRVDLYGKVSLAKPIRNRLTSLIRIVNLSKNIKAAFGNFASADVHLKIEAGCGIFITKKTYALAKLEVARRMPEALASIFNRSDDKLISMMRYFGVGRSNENDMKNLHGSRLGRALAEQFWYGEYSAGDFAIKSQMMVSVLMNIKPYKDETGKYKFYQREQFASKFYKDDRLAGLEAFDTIPDNLYGAMDVVDGVFGIKEKYNTGDYEGSISEDTLNYAAGILGTLSRTLDGSLTGVERSRVHKDVFGSMLLLHRNYLLWAVQERFHGEMFRYDKGMMSTGMYRGKSLKALPTIAFKVIMSKLVQIASLGNVKDVTGYNSKYSASDIANTKRILGEYAAFLILSTGAILMSKSIGDDDEKRKESIDMWAYILLLRTTLEVGSLSSPIELWNLQKNPSAAQSFFQAAKDLYDMHSDGTYNSTIKSGIYKNKTKRFRSLTKMTPIWKNIYPSFVEPDLRNDERFIKSNVGSTYDFLDHIIYPENPRRKEDKEKGKKKKPKETIVL